MILVSFLAVLPAMAGLAVEALWNGIVSPVCGFAAISFIQGVGLFLLGQILTGGIVMAFFLVGGGIHALGHRHGEWRNHWHGMTPDERREFIERRRREHFGFRTNVTSREDAAK